MAAIAPESSHEESLRDARAAHLIHAYHRGAYLHEFVPGEAPVTTLLGVVEAAPDLLAGLTDVYGIDEWNEDLLTRHYWAGALAAWRPGSIVDRKGPRVRVESRSCPILEAAKEDPRLCKGCQLMQEAVARLALPGRIADHAFTRLVTAGEGSCVSEIRLRTDDQR